MNILRERFGKLPNDIHHPMMEKILIFHEAEGEVRDFTNASNLHLIINSQVFSSD